MLASHYNGSIADFSIGEAAIASNEFDNQSLTGVQGTGGVGTALANPQGQLIGVSGYGQAGPYTAIPNDPSWTVTGTWFIDQLAPGGLSRIYTTGNPAATYIAATFYGDRLDVTIESSTGWSNVGIYASDNATLLYTLTGNTTGGTNVLTSLTGFGAGASHTVYIKKIANDGLFIVLVSLTWDFYAPTADVGHVLTGVVGTGQAGTDVVQETIALTGVSATGSAGTALPSVGAADVSVSATGSAGTLTPWVQRTISGVNGTGAAGGVTPQVAAIVSGASGTGQAGSASDQGSASINGTASSGAAGGVVAQVTITLSGVAGDGAAGSASDELDGSIIGAEGSGEVDGAVSQIAALIDGVSATGSVGTVTIQAGTSAEAAIVGVEGTGDAGSLTDQVTITSTGAFATGEVGSASDENDNSISGASGTGAADDLTPQVIVTIEGVSGSGQVDDVGGEIDVTISGAAASGQVGVPSDQPFGSITGEVADGIAGDLTPQATITLSGAAATSQVSGLSGEIGSAVTGTAGSGQVSNLFAEIDVFLQGVEGDGAAGVISISGNQQQPISGVAGSSSAGTLADEIDIAIGGASSSGLPGSLTTEVEVLIAGISGVGLPGALIDDISATIGGLAGSGASGSLTTLGGTDTAIAGAFGTGLPGALTDKLASEVGGLVGSGLPGSLNAEIDAAIVGTSALGAAGILEIAAAIFGSSASALVGSLIDEIDVSGIGVVATGQVGSATVPGGTRTPNIDGTSGTGHVGMLMESAVSSQPQATVGLYNNLSNTDVMAVDPLTSTAIYASFSTGDNSGFLTRLQLVVESSLAAIEGSGGGGEVDVSLYSDNNGVPGTFVATIGSFLDSDVSSSLTTITLTPTPSIPLDPNARYWVQASGNDTTTSGWVLLGNDGGAGVDGEYWYTASQGVTPNTDGPSYQMGVDAEYQTGATGVGLAGSVTVSSVSLHKKRSGRGADTKFTPALFSKPEERETDVQALTRWRKIVDDLLELPPRQAAETGQPEPDRPSDQDFTFLNSLDLRPSDASQPVEEAEHWREIAEADDLLLLGEGGGRAEADDLLLLGDWL